MKKPLFLSIAILLCFCPNIWAQEHTPDSRKQEQLKVEQKIEKFIQEHFDTADPTEYISHYGKCGRYSTLNQKFHL